MHSPPPCLKWKKKVRLKMDLFSELEGPNRVCWRMLYADPDGASGKSQSIDELPLMFQMITGIRTYPPE
jgi:hypothetical protein